MHSLLARQLASLRHSLLRDTLLQLIGSARLAQCLRELPSLQRGSRPPPPHCCQPLSSMEWFQAQTSQPPSQPKCQWQPLLLLLGTGSAKLICTPVKLAPPIKLHGIVHDHSCSPPLQEGGTGPEHLVVAAAYCMERPQVGYSWSSTFVGTSVHIPCNHHHTLKTDFWCQ